MKSPRIVLLVALVFCMFMGITAISLGVGAAFPSINQIAAPLVCPNGSLEPNTKHYNPHPGKMVTTVNWTCIDAATQTSTSVSKFQIALIAGSVYGLGLFVLLFVLVLLRGNRRTA